MRDCSASRPDRSTIAIERSGTAGKATQRQFEAAFGAKRTADMRALLHSVAATHLGIITVGAEA
jgi:hypothetical protein